MPSKSKRRRLFTSPGRQGIAVTHVSENYSTIPSNFTDLRKGHIFFLWNTNDRIVGQVEKVLHSLFVETNNTSSSYYYSILKVTQDLSRFKQLTDQNQFQNFEKECCEQFKLISTVSDKLCSPLSTPSRALVAPPVCPTQNVIPSPLKTRRTCKNCKLLRTSLRKCLSEKLDLQRKLKPRKYNRKTENEGARRNYGYLGPRRLRETLKRRDTTIDLLTKKVNDLEGRYRQSENAKVQNEMKCQFSKLSKSEEKKEKKIKLLQRELGGIKTKNAEVIRDVHNNHKKEIRELETYYQNKLLELQEQLEELKNSVSSTKLGKDGKMYSYEMRVIVYECLHSNVPTDSIPRLITVFANRFGVEVKNIPSRASVETMAVELGVISDYQAAEFLYSIPHATLGFDATTQEGAHVNEIHATSKDQCLVLSLEELAGGKAEDYASHVVRTIEHLAQMYCGIEGGGLSVDVVNKELQSHVGCSMSDRAAANHAAIRLVNEEFGTTLMEVNCHLHPLDSIATKVKTALKSSETGLPKSKLFSGVCRAEKVVLALNKMRFKDGKGDPHGFRVFLDDRNLPRSLVVRYRGNRLHVLFKLASIYILHHSAIKEYLESHCLCNTELRTGLVEEFSRPATKLQLQVLAVFSKILTGPWMKKFYRDAENQLHHLDAFEEIKKCCARMEDIASKETVSIQDITTDFFGDALDQSECEIWTVQVECETEFSNLFKLALQAAIGVLWKQYSRYYDLEITEELRKITESSRTHNMDSEEVMGMFSAGQSRAPRATMLFLSSKIRAKKNKTVNYLLSHPKSESIVKASVKAAVKLRKRVQISAAELKKEVSNRVAEKMQRKQDADRKKVECQVKALLALNDPDLAQFEERFPDADCDTLMDIASGAIVKRHVVHSWAVKDSETGHYSHQKYNGKIEKLKKGFYTVCYWGKDQTYESDGEDTKLRISEIAVDFLCGDLQFVD